ncbi:hypothetical protein TeGR_g8076 [Tetraparma gracilis]|uniref:Uncharacterized protein n=1 Tax=Tetraparma gracilis TaxID=2962635 RepID=A0ABQ6M8F9_9STRA|nr:hypothetical protein TeGR_g8076 [Tetraparma gracilis]
MTLRKPVAYADIWPSLTHGIADDYWMPSWMESEGGGCCKSQSQLSPEEEKLVALIFMATDSTVGFGLGSSATGPYCNWETKYPGEFGGGSRRDGYEGDLLREYRERGVSSVLDFDAMRREGWDFSAYAAAKPGKALGGGGGGLSKEGVREARLRRLAGGGGGGAGGVRAGGKGGKRAAGGGGSKPAKKARGDCEVIDLT